MMAATGEVFYIFDHPLLPTPYNHRFFVEKFGRGFAVHGYEVRRITRLSEITAPGFVMVSNHDLVDWLFQRRVLGTVLSGLGLLGFNPRRWRPIREWLWRQKLRTLKSVVGRSKLFESTVIAWFWDPYAAQLDMLDCDLIYTGEYFFADPIVPQHKEWKRFYEDRDDAIPIRFAADRDPASLEVKDIGGRRFSVSFVGAASYKPSWYLPLENDPTNSIIPTPPYISENDRTRIYADSKVILGLHSDVNISNHVVVERVYEALAFGAVCVSDHPDAPVATGGAAIYASSQEELDSALSNLLADQDQLQLRASKGVDFVRSNGTYAHRAAEFIARRRSPI